CFLCFNKKGKCKANYFTIIRGILIGFYIGIGGFLVYKNTLQNIFYNTKVKENPGLALTFILFSEMVNSLNNIDLNESIFLTYQNNFKVVGCVVMCVSILIGAIKHGRICGYMGIENVDVSEALFVLSLSFGVLVIDEIMKLSLILIKITLQESLQIFETGKLLLYDISANWLGLIYKCSVAIIPHAKSKILLQLNIL
ncbi:E1-E2 ATPase, partial [Hamiltosporidium tvaerminnensis]